MNDAACRAETCRASPIGDAVAQVGFLEIQEEPFIEQADLVQRRLPEHHAGACAPIHARGVRGTPMGTTCLRNSERQ